MLYRSAQATDILLPRWHQQCAAEVMLYRGVQTLAFSSVDGGGCVRLKLCCTRARNQSGALGAIAPSTSNCTTISLHPLALRFVPYVLTWGMYRRLRSSPSLLPCLVDFIANDFAPSGILAWLRAWLGGVKQCIGLLYRSVILLTFSWRRRLIGAQFPRLGRSTSGRNYTW